MVKRRLRESWEGDLEALVRALKDLESGKMSDLIDDERDTVIRLVKKRIAEIEIQLARDNA